MLSWRKRPRHGEQSVSPAGHDADRLLALRKRGRSLLEGGDPAAARRILDESLRSFPDDAELNLLSGFAQLALEDAQSALDHFHLALHYDPANAFALRGRVQALERIGQSWRIETAYREFLSANPENVEALCGMAGALCERGEFDQAAELLQSALQRQPERVDALNLLGLVTARDLGQLQAGERLIRRALEIHPDHEPARSNLGWILALQRRYEEALDCLNQVLERNPADHETRLMRAYLHLRRGDFAEGWKDIEARHHSRLAVPRQRDLPEWRGEQLIEKGLLVYPEQGVGDQIMYASCLEEVLERAARVIIECEPRLVPLFQRSFPRATVRADSPHPPDVSWRHDFGKVDCQIAMGSVPALFRTAWSDFPRHHGYLRADPEKVQAWKRRLEALSSRRKIGISWRGGSLKTRTQLRSIPIESWRPILNCEATLVSLQYGAVDQDLRHARESAGIQVLHFPEAIEDFEETAALIESLDLVISVCTWIVHLAGALGKETWVLTPSIPEWRYLDAGNSMPWYPSVRLFRQRETNCWEPVIADIARLLDSRLATESLPR